MTDEQVVGVPERAGAAVATRRWRRAGYGVVGVVGIGLAIAFGASIASASPHSPAMRAGSASTSSSAAAGVTLCAKHSGAVTYTKKANCPHGDIKLSVGKQAQFKTLTTQMKSLTTKVRSLTTQVTSLKTQLATANSKIAAQQTQVTSFASLLTGVSRGVDADGYEALTIAGENVQIDDGSGVQQSTNGLGNLFIGYDKDGGSASRTGSNNLIVGDANSWGSYGSLLAGEGDIDTVNGDDSIDLGSLNTVAAAQATVLGGFYNNANVTGSAILGGEENTVTGNGGTIVGGEENTVSSEFSSILGGAHQTSSSTDCSAIPTGVSTTNC